MIVIESLSENKARFFSDLGFKICQIETGRLYDEAIHILPCKYTYKETDIESDYKPNYKALLDIIIGEENAEEVTANEYQNNS